MIHLNQQSVSLGSEVLFRIPKYSLTPEDRVALLAPNGAGKSVFMRQLVERVLPHTMRIAYCPQQLEPGRRALSLESWMSHASDDYNVHEFCRLCQIRSIPMDRPVASLSGGQERMAALLFTLCHAAELYFFDEPTNHLDISSILWFERYLSEGRHGYFIVSHDVAFLKRTVSGYWAVHDGVLRYYNGDYDYYLRARADEEEAMQAERRRMHIALAQEERYRERGVTARRKRNQKRLERLEQLRMQLRVPRAAQTQFSDLSGQERPARQVLIELKDWVPHVYSSGVPKALTPVSRSWTRQACVALVGPNGIGKTRFVHAVLDASAPGVRHRPLMSVVFLDQMRSLPKEATVLDLIAGGAAEIPCYSEGRCESLHPLSYLKRFGLSPDRAGSRYGDLSGGEKMKVCLARALSRPVDVLVLDEPSNDLDIETIEELAEFIVGFQSLVILVTHDRYLIDQCATETWYLSSEACVVHPGGFEERLCIPSSVPVSESKPQKHKQERALMKSIEEYEKKLKNIEDALSDSTHYYKEGVYDPSAIQALQSQRAVYQEHIARLYAEWSELC